jgi:hypothetical protein
MEDEGKMKRKEINWEREFVLKVSFLKEKNRKGWKMRGT